MAEKNGTKSSDNRNEIQTEGPKGAKAWAMNFLAVLFGLFVVFVFLFVLEVYAQKQLKTNGISFPKLRRGDKAADWKFINTMETWIFGKSEGGKIGTFGALDPLLGYARIPDETKPRNDDALPLIFVDHFAVYLPNEKIRKKIEDMNESSLTKELIGELERPLIVTLGGSTTDPLQFPKDSSWPEELARIMAEKNIPGTVLNGAVGGFSSSQEMLKLLRDVLEIEPDLVVSYSGVNEIQWRIKEYPLHHVYQKELMGFCSGPSTASKVYASAYFPNLTYYARLKIFGQESLDAKKTNVHYGVKTSKTPCQYTMRNVRIAQSLCREFGIEYHFILQPFVGYNKSLSNEEKELYFRHEEVRDRVAKIRSMYEEADNDKDRWPKCVSDFRNIFDDLEPGEIFPYANDFCHVTLKGNRILAERMFGEIVEPFLKRNEIRQVSMSVE